MKQEVIEILEKLKVEPSTEKVDHILLLEKIYSKYSRDIKELEPIVHFYLNGFENIPTLNEKHLWKESNFIEQRKDFINAHIELVELIEITIKVIKNNESDSFNNELTKLSFLKFVKSGKTEFEDIELENIDLRNEKLSGLTFRNCFISVDFRNADLSNTKFIGSNIKTSDFRKANLTNGLMENVSFEATRFKDANVKGFIFNNNHCHSITGLGQAEFLDWIIETE